MTWLKSFSLAAVLVGISHSLAHAAPIAVEEFDYGASSTPLNGSVPPATASRAAGQ